MTDQVRHPRIDWLLLSAAASTTAGVVIAATGPRTIGGVLVVIGWLGLIYGLHRLGRLGSS